MQEGVWEGMHHARNNDDLRYTLDVRDGYLGKDPIIIVESFLPRVPEYSAMLSKGHFDIRWRARA